MIGLGTQELIIIFVIVMVLFGAKRLPEIGRGMGQAIRNFKSSINHDTKELSQADRGTETDKTDC
jgi:sec-independent protein translocase protein TatA